MDRTKTLEENRALLQDRLAVFGKWLFLITLAIGVSFGLADAFFIHADDPARLEGSHDLIYQFVPLAMWLSMRRGKWSNGVLRWVDAGSMAAFSLAFVLACVQASSLQVPFARGAMVFGAGIFAITRAIVVPSTWLRTLWLSAMCVMPVAVGVGWLMAHLPAASDFHRQGGGYIESLCWATFNVAVATAASRIIFGLRREAGLAKQLGQYRLEEKIGEGGMGEVYRATHAMMRRPTAVKLLLSDRAGELSLARFEREVQLTAQLTHPNTVTIFDYGQTPQGVFYYAMELLDGATLDEIVKVDGAQPPARVLKILTEVADALSEAHGIGLIHRDIKPSNIICCEQGGKADVAKLVDFGLVKELNVQEDVALTQANSVTGTPLYISPESITRPEEVDARSDLYALGAVGYFLLTGEHVFTGDTVVEVCGHHMHAQPVPPSKRLGAALPADLESLLLSCLEKDPSARPQSAAKLRELLLACVNMGEWNEGRARAWWGSHHDEVRALRPQAGEFQSSKRMAIDLTRAEAS